jgi:hypothetical protein
MASSRLPLRFEARTPAGPRRKAFASMGNICQSSRRVKISAGTPGSAAERPRTSNFPRFLGSRCNIFFPLHDFLKLQISAWKPEHQPSGRCRREAAGVNRKPRFSLDDPPQGKVYFSMQIPVIIMAGLRSQAVSSQKINPESDTTDMNRRKQGRTLFGISGGNTSPPVPLRPSR